MKTNKKSVLLCDQRHQVVAKFRYIYTAEVERTGGTCLFHWKLILLAWTVFLFAHHYTNCEAGLTSIFCAICVTFKCLNMVKSFTLSALKMSFTGQVRCTAAKCVELNCILRSVGWRRAACDEQCLERILLGPWLCFFRVPIGVWAVRRIWSQSTSCGVLLCLIIASRMKNLSFTVLFAALSSTFFFHATKSNTLN